MMTEEEFLIKCSELSRQAREKQGTPIFMGGTPKGLPNYYLGYDELVKAYEEARNHAYGWFPASLIANNKPLQTDEEFEYIKNTYQPITKDTFVEFSNTVKRSLMNGKIIFPNTDDELKSDYEDFLKKGVHEYQSFKLFALAMSDEKIIDANGLVGVWVDFDTKEVDDAEVITGQVRPYPVLYNVVQVVFVEQNEYIVELAERSVVKYGNSDKKEGRIYRFFGEEFLYEAKQYGKYVEDLFDLSYEFEHELGYTPASRLMGNPNIINNKLHFESIFDIAVPHLNNAALDSSNLVTIKNKSVYPTRVVVREKCGFNSGDGSCDNGYILKYDGNSNVPTKITCPNCRGTGYHGVFGPMSEVVVNQTPSSLDEGKTSLSASNALAYVSPPIEAPKFLSEEVEKALNRSQEVLHLKSEPRSSGDISATEKNRDVKNTEAFIKPISDQIWFLVELLINSMGEIRYGDSYDSFKPIITTPVTFDLLTPEDYLKGIQEAKESGMPSIIVQQMTLDYFMSLSKNNPDEAKVYNLAVQADRLLGMTIEQIAVGMARGLIKPWEAILHQSVLYFIETATLKDESFLEKPIESQIEEIKAMAMAAAPSDGLELPEPEEI